MLLPVAAVACGRAAFDMPTVMTRSRSPAGSFAPALGGTTSSGTKERLGNVWWPQALPTRLERSPKCIDYGGALPQGDPPEYRRRQTVNAVGVHLGVVAYECRQTLLQWVQYL
jgi:hypothetical protein